MILLWFGMIAFLVGAVWIAVIAFQAGEVWWGIGSLLIPLVTLIYAVQNFEECKIPFGIAAVGFIARIGGIFLVS